MDCLATSNLFDELAVIHIGDPVPFNGALTSSGSSIRKLDMNTFQFETPGTYFIEYIGLTISNATLGSVQLGVNGFFGGVQLKLNENFIGPVISTLYKF